MRRRLFHTDRQVLGGIEYRMLAVGKSFTVKDRTEGVSDDDSAYYLVINEGERNAWIIVTSADATGRAYVNVYFDFTVSDNGTQLPIVKHNMLLADVTATSLKVYASPTVTSTGDPVLKDLITGAGGKKSVGSEANIGMGALIPPGSKLLVEIINKSGATGDVAFEINWWEE